MQYPYSGKPSSSSVKVNQLLKIRKNLLLSVIFEKFGRLKVIGNGFNNSSCFSGTDIQPNPKLPSSFDNKKASKVARAPSAGRPSRQFFGTRKKFSSSTILRVARNNYWRILRENFGEAKSISNRRKSRCSYKIGWLCSTTTKFY